MQDKELELGQKGEHKVEVEVSHWKNLVFISLGKAGGGDGGAGLNIYTSEASGLKISPRTVLITSLVYVGVVVFLHIWQKMMRGSGIQEGETSTGMWFIIFNIHLVQKL